MQLGSRIGVSNVAIGLMLLALGFASAYYILRLQNLNSQLLDNEVSSMRAAVELDILAHQVLHELDHFLISGDQIQLANAAQKHEDVKAWLNQAVTLSKSDREAALVAEMYEGTDRLFTQLQRLAKAPDGVVPEEEISKLVDEVLTRDVLAYAQQYLTLNEQELLNGNERVKSMARRVAVALLLLGTCGAIAGLLTGYGMARQLSHSIFQLSVPIRDVAGKLNEVVGPIKISADPNVAELEALLQRVSAEVDHVLHALHARHQEAIRADQLAAVGQLAAGLAHEFRNPLMCMKTLVQAARRRGDGAQLDAQDLRVLDEEITRLNRLLQAFLDFARPAKLQTESVDIASLVHQTVHLLSQKAAARQVTIRCERVSEPLVVLADAAQLRQVLLNLLLNALDAVSTGGHIEVDVAPVRGMVPGNDRQMQECLEVRVRVSDNGHGLPQADQHRIFEPFFSTKDTGLGLGLAISRRIIEAHGGRLVGANRREGGAVFEVHLPAQLGADHTGLC